MIRIFQFRNRKGREGGCRNYKHAKTMAWIEFKKEHFMSHREMRRYWNEFHGPNYGSLCLASRWLETRKRKRNGNSNT